MVMKIKIIDIDLNRSKAKATIHISGKLGFNMEAATAMDLAHKRTFQFATDEEKNDIIYLIESAEDKGVAKVSKAGTYYYLNVGDVFATLGFDYKNYTIIFEIAKDEYDGKNVYVLTQKRKIPRKDKNELI